MKKALYRFIYHRILGWTIDFALPPCKKYVLCIAPHTSNWDFVLGTLCSKIKGLKINFLMKKEWFKGPLGTVFRRMGGIPVARGESQSLVEQLSETARKSDEFRLAVTPEGTRSANARWKRGFYYIALLSNIPIVLIAFDYRKKCITATKTLFPSGNVEQEMREIKQYYKNFQGKHPRNFAT